MSKVTTALVTGSAGFAGYWLVRELENHGCRVIKFDYREGNDVRDYERVRAAMETEPDLIFHLAGVSQPGEALNDPRRTMNVNIIGALNILEAVRNTRSSARVLLAGSSEEYGYEKRDADEILTETSLCRPSSSYGVSKLAATTLGMSYVQRHSIPVVAVRPFNHTGWGRQAVNAESAFARRIVAVERGEADVVTHGDLSASRNFTDVRDMVQAYWAAIHCEPGIYNACSPWTLSLAEVMDILVSRAECAISLKQDASLGHRVPGPFPKVSAARLCAATGWEARRPPADMFGWLLAYWRSR